MGSKIQIMFDDSEYGFEFEGSESRKMYDLLRKAINDGSGTVDMGFQKQGRRVLVNASQVRYVVLDETKD